MEIPLASLNALNWHPASEGTTPLSKPDGDPVEVRFVNSCELNVELFYLTPEGVAKSYGAIAPSAVSRQRTHPGTVWEIRIGNGTRLGWFAVGDRTAKAVIPNGN